MNTNTQGVVMVPVQQVPAPDRTQSTIDAVLGLVVCLLTWWNTHQGKRIRTLETGK